VRVTSFGQPVSGLSKLGGFIGATGWGIKEDCIIDSPENGIATLQGLKDYV